MAHSIGTVNANPVCASGGGGSSPVQGMAVYVGAGGAGINGNVWLHQQQLAAQELIIAQQTRMQAIDAQKLSQARLDGIKSVMADIRKFAHLNQMPDLKNEGLFDMLDEIVAHAMERGREEERKAHNPDPERKRHESIAAEWMRRRA